MAYANSGPPIKSDNGQGIVFEKNDKVKITNEVLDINILNRQTAKVTATYTMKNISNDSLSVNSMFLYPLDYSMPKETKVLCNEVMLDYDLEYYGDASNDKNSYDDWETILLNNKNNSKPFGDGSGFIEYNFYNMYLPFQFIAEDYYFVDNLKLNSISDDTLIAEILGKESKLITRQILNLNESESKYECEYEYKSMEVDNIYEYIKDYYKGESHLDLLAMAMSKYFFYNIGKGKEELNGEETLYLRNLKIDNNKKYMIGAITYTQDFAPEETIKVVVQYDYILGSEDNGRNFKYYLTPAKYWQDFCGIEINLHLNEDFPRLTSSSLGFKKLDKFNYQYNSNNLPQNELYFSIKPPTIASNVLHNVPKEVLVLAIIVLIVVVVIIIAAVSYNN